MRSNIFGLIKFGEEKHIKDLQKGLMYMNPIIFYEKIENTNAIGDKDEGLGFHLLPEKITLTIDNHVIDSNDIVKPILLRINKEQNINIFCMYAITFDKLVEHNLDFILDKIVKNFGNYCLVITNRNKFLERVNNAIENINKTKEKKIEMYEKGFGLVEYVDKETYHGKIGVFRKFEEYEYQNEFRLALEVPNELRGEKGEFRLKIGDISDISKLCRTDKLEDKIEVKYNKE